MSVVINEKKMMDDALFKYEERVKSPLSRFIDKSFTPVNYFHINNLETTMDAGFNNAENVLGDRSPFRFQEIKGLPIYGLEQMMISLQDTDQGLDGGYEGEGTILPGTLVPLQNDYFIIPTLKEPYIFQITSVDYDTIMPDNFYKISFTLEYIDNEKKNALNSQSNERFTCVMENIGTEDRCLIEDEYYNELQHVDSIYDEMVRCYLTFFYNERYNCLLGDFYHGQKLYDPLQTEFINQHSLFNKKNDLKAIILNEMFEDNRRKVKYEKSIYRFIEKRDWKKLSNFSYVTFPGTNNQQTSFYHWADRNVQILDITNYMGEIPHYDMISEEFLNIIKLNGPTESSYAKLIKKYVRNEEPISFSDIGDDLLDELLQLDDANLEIFFFTPIILYIIKDMVSSFMKRKLENENE